MRAIRIDNPLLDSYITDLSADYASGVSASVRNNNSFAANDIAVFGNPSEELSESKKINSISGSTGFTLASTLNFAHNKGTPVYKTLWDFVSIEANYGSGFSVITLSGIQWDSKINKTIYFDPNGTDTTNYRFRFYNSVSTLYSEYSPTLSGAGFTRFQAGYIIQEARRIAGDKEGRIMKISELLRSLTRAKYAIKAHNPRYWFWRVDGYNSNKTITPVSTTTVYDLSSITDFSTIDLIEYRYNNGATNQKWTLRKKTDVEFLEYTRDLNRPSNDFPHFFRLLPPDANSTKGYFEVETKILNPGYGTFYISYYKDEPDYNSVDDLTSIVIPEIYTDYLAAEIYATKGNDTEADRYKKLFNGPQGRKKTSGLEDLSGIALLDELDRQSKKAQGQPTSLWKFRGQKAMSRLYGNRTINNPDYIRENYFDGPEI